MLSMLKGSLVVLLVVAAALGSYLLPLTLFGVNFYAFRVLTLVLVLFATPLTSPSTWWFNLLARRSMIILVLWWLYATLATFWAWSPEMAPVLRSIVALTFGIAVVLVLLNLKVASEQNLAFLRRGWVMAYVAAGLVALWELTTGNHLPSTQFERFPEYFSGGVAQSTFGNPNNYGAFIVLAAPFLLWSIQETRGLWRGVYLALCATVPVLLVTAASRFSMVAFLLQFAVFLSLARRNKLLSVLMVGIYALAVVYAGHYFLQTDFPLATKFEALAESRPGSSADFRLALSLNGLRCVYFSGGLGVGPGGFPACIDSDYAIYQSGTIVDSHNWWVELLTEYGVFGFAAFVSVLGWIVVIALRNRRRLPRRDRGSRVARVVIVALAGYAFAAMAHSSYLDQPVHWMFIASLISLGVYLQARLKGLGQVRAAAHAPVTGWQLARNDFAGAIRRPVAERKP
jgi:teichuronic acid biosynthesis protein TuaE